MRDRCVEPTSPVCRQPRADEGEYVGPESLDRMPEQNARPDNVRQFAKPFRQRRGGRAQPRATPKQFSTGQSWRVHHARWTCRNDLSPPRRNAGSTSGRANLRRATALETIVTRSRSLGRTAHLALQAPPPSNFGNRTRLKARREHTRQHPDQAGAGSTLMALSQFARAPPNHRCQPFLRASKLVLSIRHRYEG